MVSRLLGIVVTTAVLAMAEQALAEPEATVKVVPSGDYAYTFDDQDLFGQAFGATGYLLRVRATPIHTMLLRPRTTLVPEILHSVEDM
ncbi:MAG: hypothetical protein JW940_06230 [Polyangiaceae bacterium]|nr:hypothetical protein [Polyangiaceae bacterium]